jgi:hypothetical protein
MLLTDDLRARLPRLHSQEAEEEPWVYARLFLPGTARAWYLFEGEPEGEDYLFFGFVSGSNEFREFRLSELHAVRGLFGEQVECDLTFTAGRLTDVVPAPDS